MKELRSWTLRIAAISVMLLSLTGPAPGSAGGCGAENPIISPTEHCLEVEEWSCVRDHSAAPPRTPITDDELAACRDAIPGRCAGVGPWPELCSPTFAQSQACIDLLRRVDLLHLTTEELNTMHDECRLCP